MNNTTAKIPNVRETAKRLRREWELAYEVRLVGGPKREAALQETWNKLISHVEANGLSGSEYDHRTY